MMRRMSEVSFFLVTCNKLVLLPEAFCTIIIIFLSLFYPMDFGNIFAGSLLVSFNVTVQYRIQTFLATMCVFYKVLMYWKCRTIS